MGTGTCEDGVEPVEVCIVLNPDMVGVLQGQLVPLDRTEQASSPKVKETERGSSGRRSKGRPGPGPISEQP